LWRCTFLPRREPHCQERLKNVTTRAGGGSRNGRSSRSHITRHQERLGGIVLRRLSGLALIALLWFPPWVQVTFVLEDVVAKPFSNRSVSNNCVEVHFSTFLGSSGLWCGAFLPRREPHCWERLKNVTTRAEGGSRNGWSSGRHIICHWGCLLRQNLHCRHHFFRNGLGELCCEDSMALPLLRFFGVSLLGPSDLCPRGCCSQTFLGAQRR
jgi:hypothetical protein